MEINKKSKARFWVGVLYPENMIEDWDLTIGDIVQVPYSYCIHDKDKLSDHVEDRKVHVHILLAFPNTTTYNHALKVFSSLSADGKRAINTCEEVFNIRSAYEYLIHNTETCKKKKKYIYDKSERIDGNNFDIGSYEQVSLSEKQKIRKELSSLILEKDFTNYLDFYIFVISNYDSLYEEVICNYSGHFERLTKGNFHKYQKKLIEEEKKGKIHLKQKINRPKVKAAE